MFRRYPFLCTLALGLLLSQLASRAGIQYDSGGAASVIFYLGLLLQFPVWIMHDFVSASALPEDWSEYRAALDLAGAIAMAAVCDGILRGVLRWRRHRSRDGH